MNKTIIARLLIAFATCSAATWASAEDIDIFSTAPVSPGAPNVLIVLDSSAKWSQSFGSGDKFDAVKSAMTTVVTALKTQFNLGLMMNSETGNPNSNVDGAYVRFAIQPMSNTDGTATDARNCLLKMTGASTTCTMSGSTYYTNLDRNADKGNGTRLGATMAEAYDYFAGVNAYSGNNKAKADVRAFLSGTVAGPKYIAPVVGACGKNYIIYINNGAFADNASDTTTARNNLSSAGGNTAVINPPDNGTSNDNVGDEWTRWLNKSAASKVVTYTIEVGPETNTQGRYTTALMQSMGTQGKGGYYSATTAQQLLDALTRVFNDIQATNSVFASSSLPLSADNSGAFANQIYMGIFRPDAQGKPRWVGNIKQYQFAVDLNKNLSIVDAANQPAASTSGFAQPDAVSFWTKKDTTTAPDAATAVATSAATGSTAGFWYFDNKGSGGAFDSPDGEWVEKGGAAQQMRLAYLGYGGRGGIGDTNASTLNSSPARKVLTCTSATCLSNGTMDAFDSTNAALTTTAFGAADAAELALMLKWIRGQDTQNENNYQVNTTNTDVRSSIHGDILHSRPIVLNYGTPATTDNVYLFYGGNDGVFRAIKGGQATTDGAEQWAFIPSEFFGKMKRLYNNSPQVLYPSTSPGIVPAPTRRDYFFDGPVGSYVERAGTGGAVSKAYLYLGLRRGGNMIYALDVTSPTSPKLLWVKKQSDSGFGELGQTWSQPKIAKIKGNTNPVLIFGAGYDAAKEDTEPPAAVDTIGRAIYMIDAFTGAPLWAAGKTAPAGMPKFTTVSGMDFSIASDIVVLDRSFDGYADRIYATDVGGNVWRVDIDDYATATAGTGGWTVSKLAALADRTAVASTRKFLFGTEVVLGKTYDAVFVGSGDREHPLASNAAQSVINRFYMLKDVPGPGGTDLGITDSCAGTMNSSCSNLADATPGSPGTPQTVAPDAKGWAVKFGTGEKVVNGPLVVAGHILFGTNQPDTTGESCTANLGIARRYDIKFNLTSTVIDTDSDVAPGGGFLPPVVAGSVEIGGQKYLFTTDNPLSPGGPSIHPAVSGKRSRTFWRSLDQ